MPEVSIITIGGEVGAGKSTVALALALKTGFTRISAGNIQRERCKDPKYNPKNLDLQQWIAQLTPEQDQEIEEEMKQTAGKKDHLIMEGRMAFSWVPHGKPVLKVFLSVNPEIGAQRIFQQRKSAELGRASSSSDQKRQSSVRSEEKACSTPEEVMKDIEKRKEAEIRQYTKIYGLDPYDLKYYDLVIDTSYQTPEEVVQQILDSANLDKGSTIYAGL